MGLSYKQRVRTKSIFTCCIPECLWPTSPRAVAGHVEQGSYLPVIILCCLVAIICSIDRTAMSVAILPMSQRYGWTSSDKGAISSAFNWGHTLTNLIGGWAAATYPPKHVLTAGVIVWSAFTILTPGSAAVMWMPALLFVRACMGLGEGVAFPTMQAIIKGWVPSDKRSRALSLMYSGHQIGSILSLLISPGLLTKGVDLLFYVYGSLGFLWLAAWQPLISSQPPVELQPPPVSAGPSTPKVIQNSSLKPIHGASVVIPTLHEMHSYSAASSHDSHMSAPHHRSSACARDTDEHSLQPATSLESGRQLFSSSGGGGVATSPRSPMSPRSVKSQTPAAAPAWKDMPWRAFGRSPTVWALALAHGVFGLTYSICIAWLPTYYADEFQLDVKQSSLMSVLPWVAMAVGTNLSGWTADYMVNGKVLSLTKSRKVCQLVGCGGPALCMAYLAAGPRNTHLGQAGALLTMALGTLGWQAGGFASTHQDIASRYAPILFGMTNACASLVGSFGVYGVGAILDRTASWSLVLLMVAVANGLSLITYIAFSSSEPQFD